MVITHDGGVMVTLNGGKTWSTPFTQPNQQVYRVDVDDEFPYNLYGNCQDLIGYKVPSASVSAARRASASESPVMSATQW